MRETRESVADEERDYRLQIVARKRADYEKRGYRLLRDVRKCVLPPERSKKRQC